MGKNIKRNDPYFCGSVKKYKKCCFLKEEAINLVNYKYDKYLQTRDSATSKIIDISDKKLGISLQQIISHLADYPIFDNRNIDPFSYSEDQAVLYQYLLNSYLLV